MNLSHPMLVKAVSEVDCDLQIVADQQLKRLLSLFDRPGPVERLTCMILGNYYALTNFVTLPGSEQAAIGALLALQQPQNEHLLDRFTKMLDNRTGPDKMAELICSHLVSLNDVPAELKGDDVVHTAVTRAAEALDLAGPSHFLLACGGDDRIRVDWKSNGLNLFQVSSRPCPEMIIRSSATACPPDISGFERADTLRQELLEAALIGDLSAVFSTRMEQVRNRIAALLHLDRIEPLPAIVTAPSGIEAEMVLVQLAVERARELAQKGKPDHDVQPAVENVFISADEIDPEKRAAGAMQAFSTQAPDGSAVTSAFVDGVSRTVSGVVTFSTSEYVYPIRSGCQSLETRLENRLNETIHNRGRVAIVHLWAGAAAGLSCPAPEFLVRIKKKYRQRLIAVVDATQMRCDERMLAAFLENGCCVVLSGSNFIGGPPFSGALILPFAEAQTLQDAVSGLGHFISAEDVDPRLAGFRKKLPDWKNFGLLLRWHAALATMERYYALEPRQRQDLVARWRSGLLERIGRIPYLRVCGSDDSLRPFEHCHHWVEHDTVVPVSVCPAESTMGEPQAPLDQSGLMQVYQWLTDDMSARLPLQADTTDRSIAASPCLTGRPLRIGLNDNAAAVLPIAISAADILRCARGESQFAKVLEEDCLLVRKLGLIAKYFEHLNH